MHSFITALFQVMDTDSLVKTGFGMFTHAFDFWNSLWAMDGDCFGC